MRGNGRCHREMDTTLVYVATDLRAPDRNGMDRNDGSTRQFYEDLTEIQAPQGESPATIDERTTADHPPIEMVDVAKIPGGGELHLLKCGKEYSIQFGRDELMGSQDHVSEKALATLTSERLVSKNGHVLVGGLGMGFTLGAALESWSAEASITVAELIPQIVAWAKGPLAHLFGESLADPRVSLHLLDVYDVILESPQRFDAILLDVDNGPDGFITTVNDRLYSHTGLQAAYRALRPGGLLSVWSSYADDSFAGRLSASGFKVDEIILPAYVGSTERWHNIWFAAKPGDLADDSRL